MSRTEIASESTKLFLGALSVDQQATYFPFYEHLERKFPLQGPGKELRLTIKAIRAFFFLEKLTILIKKQITLGISQSRPLRFCELACGLGYSLFAIDYLCEQYGIKYEYVGIDQKLRFFDSDQKEIAADNSHIHYCEADASDPNAVCAALKAAGVELLDDGLGFDIFILDNPETTIFESELPAIFASMLTNTAVQLGNLNAECLVMTSIKKEMQYLLAWFIVNEFSKLTNNKPWGLKLPLEVTQPIEEIAKTDPNSSMKKRLQPLDKWAFCSPTPAVTASSLPEFPFLVMREEGDDGDAESSLVTPSRHQLLVPLYGRVCYQLENPPCDKTHKDAIKHTAPILYQAGHYRDALLHYLWLQTNTKIKPYFNLCCCYFAIGNYDSAYNFITLTLNGCELDKKPWFEIIQLICDGMQQWKDNFKASALSTLESAERKVPEDKKQKNGLFYRTLQATLAELKKDAKQWAQHRMGAAPVASADTAANAASSAPRPKSPA